MKRLRLLIPALALLLLLVAAGPAQARAAEDPFAEGCPPKKLQEGATAGLNHNPAARKAIVPAGATSLRICRYWGFGNEQGKQTPKTQARAGKLNDQAVVKNRPLLEGLTDEFKELEPAPKGPISCPADDGTDLYAIFSYPHAEPVVISVSLSGCRFAAGAVPRAREMTESLERKLVRLAKGEPVKAAPEPSGVKEKGVAESGPPRLTAAVAKHYARDEISEMCAEFCSSWKLAGCTRTSASAFRCTLEAVVSTGRTCRGGMSVKKLNGEGVIPFVGGSSTSGKECELLFIPPELREEFAETGRA